MSEVGFDKLLWFIGVVEDNVDPLKLGRLKVRAFGIHNQDKAELPTEDLPWCPVVDGSFGASYSPPDLNTWVMGAFMDGREGQHAFIHGSLPGMMTTLPDPEGASGYGAPSRFTNPCDLYQPNIPRLARGEYIEQTHVPHTNSRGGKEVENADGSTWTTRPSGYNAEYPHNRVIESKSGHLIEIDDTPGSERVNIRHKSGAYIEMDVTGALKAYSEGDTEVVVNENRNTYIKGGEYITSDGDVNVYAKGNAVIKSDGDLTITSHGDLDFNVAGGLTMNIGDRLDLKAGRISIESATSHMSMKSADQIKIQSGSDINLFSGESIYTKADIFSIFGDVETSGEILTDGAIRSGRSVYALEEIKAPTVEEGGVAIETPIIESPLEADPSKITDDPPDIKIVSRTVIAPRIEPGLSGSDKGSDNESGPR